MQSASQLKDTGCRSLAFSSSAVYLRDDASSTVPITYALLNSCSKLCGAASGGLGGRATETVCMLRGWFEAEARLTVLVSALTAATAALGEAG